MTAISRDHSGHIQSPLDHAVTIVRHICHVAGPVSMLENMCDAHRRDGLVTAIMQHDTPPLFNWLMTTFSFQGIADSVAEGYIARHGNVTWADVAATVAQPAVCAKLTGYATFTGCGYVKGAGTCANPRGFAACPLPLHPLRNGRLNQTAYSLFFFVRDVARGDLVSWIDRQLAAIPASPMRLSHMRAALIGRVGM